jgi:N-acetylglucosaminyldiphosphoundecaprenol N-acetyl-beta-D-mannosaminyltransferase
MTIQMKKSLIGLEIDTGHYRSFVSKVLCMSQSKSSYTCIANVHMLVEAYGNAGFAKIVNNADLVTPDGVPLTWGLMLLHGIKQDRVAGMDLLPDVLREAARNQISVYFYGGTEAMHSLLREQLPRSYPLLIVAGMFSPPFRDLTQDEITQTVEIINKSEAKVVIVCLGCPKQELWMGSMKNRINATMIGVGGALPVLLGIRKRAPRWMQNCGLEWLFRLLQEPWRLFFRYAITNSIFIYLLSKEIVRVRIFKRP